MSALLQHAAIAIAALTALAAIAVALAAPSVLRRTAGWSAEARGRVAGGLLLLPVVGPLVAVIAGIAPSLLDTTRDHCAVHGPDHLHLCLWHPPEPAAWPLLLAALAVLAVPLWRAAGRLRLERRAARAARAWLTTNPARSGDPLAATVGFWRPRVIVSDGLRQQLSPERLAAVEAHEAAHVARRDPLRRLGFALATAWHGRATGRLLVAAIDQAAEETCDRLAAEAVGDRLVVADALVATARLVASARPGVGATDGDLERRVNALLDPPAPDRRRRHWALALAALLVGAVVSGAWHHALEHGLDLLRHGLDCA